MPSTIGMLRDTLRPYYATIAAAYLARYGVAAPPLDNLNGTQLDAGVQALVKTPINPGDAATAIYLNNKTGAANDAPQ